MQTIAPIIHNNTNETDKKAPESANLIGKISAPKAESQVRAETKKPQVSSQIRLHSDFMKVVDDKSEEIPRNTTGNKIEEAKKSKKVETVLNKNEAPKSTKL